MTALIMIDDVIVFSLRGVDGTSSRCFQPVLSLFFDVGLTEPNCDPITVKRFDFHTFMEMFVFHHVSTFHTMFETFFLNKM